jgi:hypothetical protein
LRLLGSEWQGGSGNHGKKRTMNPLNPLNKQTHKQTFGEKSAVYLGRGEKKTEESILEILKRKKIPGNRKSCIHISIF